MKPLPSEALRAVLDFDYRDHVLAGGINRTRFYLWLQPDGDDLQIRTVACRAPSRWKAVMAKEVIRASVDRSEMDIKDLAYCGMAGYQVDWSSEGGRSRYWSYEGKWSRESYSRRGSWKVHGTLVNPEALQSHPRFRYCAYTEACGHPLDYLKAYVDHPRVELLSKAGLGWYARKVGFVKALERNKDLLRFVMAHLDELKQNRASVPAIRRAFRLGITFEMAESSIANRQRFKRFGLPSCVDADRAVEYARTHRLNEYHYCDYLRDCQVLGLDMADTKTLYPRHFRQRREIVADQLEAIRREQNRERTRKINAEIAATASKWAKLEREKAAFRIILPRRTKDFEREGKRLHNCLGDGHYAAKMARGETLIAFIRKARKPFESFVAVEYSPDQKRILQCYGAKNAKPPKPVLTFVNRAFKSIRRRAA